MFDSRLALPGTVARLPRKCRVRLWVLNCRDLKCSKAGPGCSFLLLAGDLPRGSPRYGAWQSQLSAIWCLGSHCQSLFWTQAHPCRIWLHHELSSSPLLPAAWLSTVLNSCVTRQVPFAPLGMDPSKLMSKRRRSWSPGKEKPNPDLAGKGPVCSAEPHFQMGDEPEELGTRLAGALAGRCPAAFALGQTHHCSCRALEHQLGARLGLVLILEQL